MQRADVCSADMNLGGTAGILKDPVPYTGRDLFFLFFRRRAGCMYMDYYGREKTKEEHYERDTGIPYKLLLENTRSRQGG